MYNIYFIFNRLNQKVYIGQSINIQKRWSNHKYSLNKGKHHCDHLQRAWNKYGEEAFEFFIVETVYNEDSANEIEKLYIEWYAEIELAYNPSWNHRGRGVVSKETREKISKRNKLLGIKPPSRKGIPVSQETKEKTRVTRLLNSKPKKQNFCGCGVEIQLWAKYCTNCLSEKRSIEVSSRTLTEEQKEKLRNLRKGTKLSSEHKLKISKTLKNKLPSNLKEIQELRQKSFKLVSPVGETIEAKNITEFSEKYKLERHRLGKLISGKISSYKGWKVK